MRVVECDICGETVTAADDEELARRLAEHLSEAHAQTPGEDSVTATIDREAYDAMDS